MKYRFVFLLIAIISFTATAAQTVTVYTSDTTYISSTYTAFTNLWPNNKTINIIFHGHSVPSGYFKTPEIQTMRAYPELTLQYLSTKYPNAVINVIKTCIGGENAVQGAERFATDVLNHKPDILFIDYALNDRGIGLEKAKLAWESMIKKALKQKTKVVLCTPTPDLKENITDTTTILYQHTLQIIALAKQYHVAVVDSYNAFRKLAAAGENLENYMSQFNHPNAKGHMVVLGEIEKLF
jgi:acyl-CoA thioesterase I